MCPLPLRFHSPFSAIHSSGHTFTLTHLDNDTAGRLAAKTIRTLLASSYIVSDEPSNEERI